MDWRTVAAQHGLPHAVEINDGSGHRVIFLRAFGDRITDQLIRQHCRELLTGDQPLRPRAGATERDSCQYGGQCCSRNPCHASLPFTLIVVAAMKGMLSFLKVGFSKLSNSTSVTRNGSQPCSHSAEQFLAIR